ncbi:MAG: cellulase family glycosylhydrolase [Oscillospiraceae bacterium]|nr:cellulase family glycosylhydrolase [Oscillospiraceae bacterium]
MESGKILSLIAAISLLLSTGDASSAAYASDSSLKDKTAAELVDEMTVGYNIGNSLESYLSWGGTGQIMPPSIYETAWGNPVITENMILKMKETGINTIRIPVTWYQKMNADNVIDTAWLERVKEVVDYVVNNDMYCIINAHHDTNSGWLKASSQNYTDNNAKFSEMWTQIADYFNDYDEHLIFEGYNEILDENGHWSYPSDDAIDTANRYNQLFVDTVRKTGGNNSSRCLVVNTYAAGVSDKILSGFVLPSDTANNRLIAEVHAYTPYPFCFADFPSVTEYDEETVVSMIDNLKEHLIDKGIPVVIGEWGCVDKGNTAQCSSYVDLYTKLASTYGIKCLTWDSGGDFKFFDRKNLSWTAPDQISIMLSNYGIEWNDKDGLISAAAQIPGDADNNSTINIADAAALQNFLLSSSTTGETDINRDGKVDIADICYLKKFLLDCVYYTESQKWIANEDDISVDLTGAVIAATAAPSEEPLSFDYKGLKLESGKTYTLKFIYQSQPDCDFGVSITDGINAVMTQKLSATFDESSCTYKFTAPENAENLVCHFEIFPQKEETDLILQDFAIY